MMMTTKSATESDNINKIDLGNLVNNDNEPSSMIINNSKIRICVHICEKKKRQCKFNAIKNSDYCVEHLAFNQQLDNSDKRMICPLDPKHSVYIKNFAKHLKKCNARIKTLGEYDIKGINLFDDNDNDNINDIIDSNNNNNNESSSLNSKAFNTYKDLDESQLKQIVDFILDLDTKLNLSNLEFNKLENAYLNQVLSTKNDEHKKHIKQISSIVTHLDVLLNDVKVEDAENESTLLCELGAGRGKLSYWFEKARNNENNLNEKSKKKINILLIERGAQRLKFDSLLKKEVEDNQSEFERMRIDLKDLYLNKVPLVEKSTNYILYGKHLCGVATDYAIRCLKHSLDNFTKQNERIKFKGFVLAVCCHHQCEYDSFCGKDFLKKFNIDSKLFYILRSISSWYTGSTNQEILFGHEKPKLGRICKNLFDYARMQYIISNISLPSGYYLKPKLFYYIETDVTLENTMLFVSIEKNDLSKNK